MKIKANKVLFPALFLLFCLSLPSAAANGFRRAAIASFAPAWSLLVDFKLLAKMPFDSYNRADQSDPVCTSQQEIQRLTLENQMLGNEVFRLQQIVEQEHALYQRMVEDECAAEAVSIILNQHQKEIAALFALELGNLPARVIYRPVNMWNSSIWVDKGTHDNEALGRIVIAKNSPVVIGTSIVGVVDEVGERQARVRLITDSGLTPSVRIKRGKLLLAKGEIQGESRTTWRSHSSLLKGVGFNYDTADGYGPARDLRSGDSLDRDLPVSHPLIQPNDLLITTGMDGVFPPGLEVGIVKRIYPLKEGDCFYNLEAESCAGDLNELSIVFILPPWASDINAWELPEKVSGGVQQLKPSL